MVAEYGSRQMTRAMSEVSPHFVEVILDRNWKEPHAVRNSLVAPLASEWRQQNAFACLHLEHWIQSSAETSEGQILYTAPVWRHRSQQLLDQRRLVSGVR